MTGQAAADKVEAAQKVAKEEAVNAEAEKAEAAKVEDKEEAKAEAPADAVVSEATRKQQLSILAAFDLIDEAYDAMDSGNWDVATEKLTLADEKIASYEYSPASDQVRSELKRARATMAKERANIAMADRDVKNAKKFAGEYAAAEENQAKAQKFTAEVDAFEENPYNNKISDVSPDYSVRLERVNALLEKGRRQYLLRRLRRRPLDIPPNRNPRRQQHSGKSVPAPRRRKVADPRKTLLPRNPRIDARRSKPELGSTAGIFGRKRRYGRYAHGFGCRRKTAQYRYPQRKLPRSRSSARAGYQHFVGSVGRLRQIHRRQKGRKHRPL